jgi:RNA polymerase sigma-70 factor (ECF subfamily)
MRRFDPSISCEELVARVRLNEREAFEILFDRHHRLCFDYAWRLLFDRRDAEDVVQDAFLRVFLAARKGAYDPAKGRFKTYLLRILRNLCYDRISARRPLNLSDLGETENTEFERLTSDLHDTITPEDRVTGQALRVRVDRALEHLPMLQREALVLRGFEGLSYKEIGRILERPISHVKIILFRARRALARALDAPAPTLAPREADRRRAARKGVRS